MDRRGFGQALRARWYLVLVGLITTAVAASAGYAMVPLRYTSTGTVVLTQALQHSANPTNPLLTFDDGLNVTASLVVQALSTPQAAASFGVVPGQDTLTVKNSGGVGSGAEGAQPFISAAAESSDPNRAMNIVAAVTARAQSELSGLEHDLRVTRRDDVVVADVIDPQPGKPDRANQVRAASIGVLGGLLLTLLAVWACEGLRNRRIRRARTRTRPAPEAALYPLPVP
jgi:hypothetical protein